jgi:hypothetical protein
VDDVAHRAEPYHEDARRVLVQRRLPVPIQSQFGGGLGVQSSPGV